MGKIRNSEPYQPPTRRQIAYHEAGHAVIARHLGLTVTNVTIAVRGYAGIETDAGPIDPSTLRRERAIMLFASEPAQRLAGPTIDHGYSVLQDQMQVEEMFPDEADHTELRAHANYLVAKHQPTIEAVAEALLDRGRLNAAELDEIIARTQQTEWPGCKPGRSRVADTPE